MADLTRIEVDNYQSIGHAELELGRLTVIVGRGNLGKSALLRAMSACIFNETGTDFIRQGTKKCTVTLHWDAEDRHVTWTKDGSSARYDVESAGTTSPFTKLAGGVPGEVQSMFGIRAIEIDKTYSITPQIHNQFDAPLLLAESAGKAARALATLTKLKVIVDAQQASARDLRRAKQDATSRQREVSELTERLNSFPDIDQQETRLLRAKQLVETADERLNILAQAEDALALMQSAEERLLLQPPADGELSTIGDRLDHLQNSLLAYKVLQQCIEGAELSRKVAPARNLALMAAEEELENFKLSLGTCPLCGSPMSVEHEESHA